MQQTRTGAADTGTRTTNPSSVTFFNSRGGSRTIDLSTVNAKAWSLHHGTARDGTKVCSLEDFQPHNSITIAIRNSEDKARFIVASEAAIEVYCRSFLTRRGFTITASSSSSS